MGGLTNFPLRITEAWESLESHQGGWGSEPEQASTRAHEPERRNWDRPYKFRREGQEGVAE